MVLPKDFTFRQFEGINALVGEIKNGTSTFFFECGPYAPSPSIADPAVEVTRRPHLDFRSLQQFLNQIDLKPYRNKNGELQPSEILTKIKSVNLHKPSDSMAMHKSAESTGNYYYSLQFDNKDYLVPYSRAEVKNTQDFELDIDTIGNYIRTISIWKAKGSPNISSVEFAPIDNTANSIELSIGIKSNTEFDPAELKTIFQRVVIKEPNSQETNGQSIK